VHHGRNEEVDKLMATLAAAPRSSRGWLPYMMPSNAYGPLARRVGDEIDRIVVHEVHTLLHKSPDISTIFSDLVGLIEGDLEDEYGILRPTQYSAGKLLQLLVSAGLQTRKRVPYGAASTDDEGGIRLEWHWRGREVRLVIPASPEGHHYIYHELDNDYGLEMRVNHTTLANWLDWLTNV
jgi:hypothetical protein